jgi:hypothetical protein
LGCSSAGAADCRGGVNGERKSADVKGGLAYRLPSKWGRPLRVGKQLQSAPGDGRLCPVGQSRSWEHGRPTQGAQLLDGEKEE